MFIHFWGVRGSIPTPLTPQQIQSKIMAAIQRITPKDIESSKSKSKFVSSLPSWIFGTAGGNTACVQIRSGNNELLFDAGSGLRAYGKSNLVPQDRHFNLFLSHYHWDHIQGLPFFDQAYNPLASFDVYSPLDNAKEVLEKQMEEPFYPVQFDSLTKNFTFHKIEVGKAIQIGDTIINCCEMSHPGRSFSYSVTENDKKVVYATDVELKSKDFEENEQTAAVFNNADIVILDSQYTVEEAYRKENWGHSAFCYAIDFAVKWNIKKIYLYHHEPAYDDKKLNSILQAARWYAQYINHSEIEIYLAKEDMEINL